MKLVLQYLATDGFFLFEECGCRIVHSRYYPGSWSGSGLVVLESPPLRIRIEQERDNLLVAFMPAIGSMDTEVGWYSFDLVMEMLTGEPQRGFQPVVMDSNWDVQTESYEEGSAFLHSRFRDFQTLFLPETWDSTSATLERLQGERSARHYRAAKRSNQADE